MNAKAENLEGQAGSKGVRASLKTREGSQAFPFLKQRKVTCQFGALRTYKVRPRVGLPHLLQTCPRSLHSSPSSLTNSLGGPE